MILTVDEREDGGFEGEGRKSYHGTETERRSEPDWKVHSMGARSVGSSRRLR